MLRKLIIVSAGLLILVLVFINRQPSFPTEEFEPPTVSSTQKNRLRVSSATITEPKSASVEIHNPEPNPTTASNPKWLDPIITQVLNTETTWNESGTEKKVISIVEADFHHPYLRIEETYSVDPYTGAEILRRYVPSTADTLLVKMKKETKMDQLRALEARYQLTTKSAILGTDIVALRLNEFLQVEELPSIIEALKDETDIIKLAEPDYLVRAYQRIPNDPQFDRQAGLNFSLLNGANRDIDAPEAWSIRTDAPSVVVAVIDSGIYLEHEDLKNNLWRNEAELENGVDDDKNGIVDDLHGANFIEDKGDPTDDDEHGTMVAGVIGATGNNGIGVAGVAWQAQLMALKFLNQQGVGLTSDGIECLQYAIDQDADIINNSWGGSGYSQALEDTLREASNKDILIVTAAGNEGNRLSDIPVYPAAFRIPNQVVVGSSNFRNKLSSFSNYDEELVHLLAPESAHSTWNRPGNTYQLSTGTSFSAPYVSGSLALLKAEFPDLRTEALISRLLSTVEIYDSFSQKCLSHGRLNVHRALIGESNVPSNDNFADAYTLEMGGESHSASLTRTSLEPQEPLAFQSMDSVSVWYQWTSPRSDRTTLRLDPPGFQGSLSVYTGEVLGLLNLVGRSRSSASGETTELSFDSVSGTTYYIQVGRTSGFGGLFTLKLALAPPNDLIINATALSENSFTIQGSTRLATLEPDEEPIHPSAAGKSVWYEWIAPVDGTFLLIANSQSGQLFGALFTGNPDSLSRGSWTQDQGLPHRLLFNAQAGERYFFGWDSQSSEGGSFSLSGQFLELSKITVQPLDVQGTIGGEAQFNVGVLATSEATYQWFHNESPLEGATQSYLLLTNLKEEDAGTYFVDIEVNGAQLRSRTANLSLDSTQLQILEHPQTNVVTAGSILRLSVFAQPAEELTYSWLKNGQPIPGQFGKELLIENASLEDNGYYFAEVSLGQETLRSNPANIRVKEGDSIFAGTAWATTQFGSLDLQSVSQAGDYFFAFAQEDNLGFSRDGQAWFYTGVPQAGDLYWVSYGNDTYVIAADQGLYWSKDLFSWEKGSTQELTSNFTQIAFGNGVFVATSATGMHRSTDGKNWTIATSAGNSNLSAVVWADDKFLALRVGGQVLTSSDGNNWQQIGTANLLFPYELHYHNGEYWTSLNDLNRSTDGVNWTKIDLPGWLGGFAINKNTGRRFLLTPEGFWEWEDDHWRLIQLNPEGHALFGLGIDGDQAVVTIDGVPQRLNDFEEDPAANERIREAFYGNGTFGGWSGDQLFSSPDGSNWSFVNTNLDRGYLGNPVAFGNQTYVFSGAYGTSLSSMNQHGYNFDLLAFGNGVFVGRDGREFLVSSDGQNWTVVGTAEASLTKNLVFAGDKFLYMDGNSIRTSTNGSSWTDNAIANPPTISYLAYGNNTYVGLFRNGGSRTSSNGLSWQPGESVNNPDGSTRVESLVFFNDRFYATSRGILFESVNGTSWAIANQEMQGFNADQLIAGDNHLILTSDAGVAVWGIEENGQSGPPFLEISGVAPGSTVSLGETLVLTTQAFSRTGSITQIKVLENNTLIAQFVPPVNSFQYTPSTLGDHLLSIEVTDSDNQKTTESIAVTAVRHLGYHLPGGDPFMWDITYYKGAFYGTGPAGIVFQSLDGDRWNRIQTPSNKDLHGFYHSDAGICAVGGGDLLFSKNGVRWHKIPLEDARWIPRQYDPSFLAIPTGFDIAWLSANGSDWYSMRTGQLILGKEKPNLDLPYEFVDMGGLYQASPAKPFIEEVYAGGERTEDTARIGGYIYEAVKRKGVFRTTDGISWEEFPLPNIENIDRVTIQAAGNGLFFIEDRYNDKRIRYFSGNGVDWEAVNGPKFFGNIVYQAGNFYCGNANSFYRSSDGLIWEIIGDAAFPELSWNDYHELLATPSGFLTSCKTDDDTSVSSYSNNGYVWNFFTKPYHELAYELVVGGNATVFATTGHGSYPLFSEEASDLKSDMSRRTVWGKGIFLDMNPSEDNLRKSIDGIKWTEINTLQWMRADHGDALFFDGNAFWYSSNDDNLLARSEDGITWSTKTYPGSLEIGHQILEFKGKLYAERYVSSDQGETWTNNFPEARQVGLTKTDSHLLAIVRISGQETELHITEGSDWVKSNLPQSNNSIPPIAATHERFYHVGGETYTSSDGSTWEKIGQGLNIPYASSVDSAPYFYGIGPAIREPSVSDLAIENLVVAEGVFGVGDDIHLNISLRNAGHDTVDLGNNLNIEFLLSPLLSAWGAGPDGFLFSSIASISSLQLTPGESITVNETIIIPDSIKPGSYSVSVHIVHHTELADTNSSNDYWLGDRHTVTIPERKLSLSLYGSGKVVSEKSLISIPHKQSLQLIPTPDFGHEFSGWAGDVRPSVDIAELMMDADKEVEATFAPRTYYVGVRIAGQGSVQGAPESEYAQFGETLRLHAMPDPNWEFLEWRDDRISKNQILNLQVGKDIQLTALFGQDFISWLANHYSEQELADPEIGSLLGDPDGNDFSNLQEFLFGMDDSTSTLPRFEVYVDGDDACLLYPRSLTAIGEARLEVWHSADLEFWDSKGIEESSLFEDGSIEYIEARLANPEGEPVYFQIRAISE